MNRDAANVAHRLIGTGNCGNEEWGTIRTYTRDFIVHINVMHQLHAAQGAYKRSRRVH